MWGSKEALAELRPIIQPGGSDSAGLDNALESVVMGGRDLLHTVMMMTPEAHEAVPEMDDDLRAFYEYHACLQEPWDGPAALSFTDGRIIGASLDRNGLRPARYQVSDDGTLIVASEVGVVDLQGTRVLEKGRLGPGQILALDTKTGELMKNDEIKAHYGKRAPYRDWVNSFLVRDGQTEIAPPQIASAEAAPCCAERQWPQRVLERFAAAAGGRRLDATAEDLRLHQRRCRKHRQADGKNVQRADSARWATTRRWPILSEKPRLLYTYFRQRFAQVTNPPIDPLREKLGNEPHHVSWCGRQPVGRATRSLPPHSVQESGTHRCAVSVARFRQRGRSLQSQNTWTPPGQSPMAPTV
jgi:hypothetical protein